MTIKYADVTINRNIDEETIFTSMSRYFGFEPYITDNDTIVVLFDDTTIYNTKDYTNTHYTFVKIDNELQDTWPYTYIIKSNEKEILLTYKKPIIDKNGSAILNFKPLFMNYPKFTNENTTGSQFNSIYVNKDNKQAFAILKIKSNEEKPRFIIAYDDSLFDKTEVITIIDNIFKHKWEE